MSLSRDSTVLLKASVFFSVLMNWCFSTKSLQAEPFQTAQCLWALLCFVFFFLPNASMGCKQPKRRRGGICTTPKILLRSSMTQDNPRIHPTDSTEARRTAGCCLAFQRRLCREFAEAACINEQSESTGLVARSIPASVCTPRGWAVMGASFRHLGVLTGLQDRLQKCV